MWVSPGSSSSSMEVDTVQVNDLNCIGGQMDEQSLSPEVSGVYDVFGDPDIYPRVGEEYQVEIPPLMSKSDYQCFHRSLHETESRDSSTLHKFRVGLPIPLIWIKDEVENNKHDLLQNACKSVGITSKIGSSELETQNGMDCDRLNPELEAVDSAFVDRMKLSESGNSSVQLEANIGNRDKNHCLVPGSASEAWNEIEEASFILGLYIFGKDLVPVKKFIGNKTMGDILSFYYGKFYKSDKYKRWCGCRKMKSRKCIYGQKIFTGPRQQELLSRLRPNVSEECHNKLLEVSKTFVEGKMPLVHYVLTLKASVGLRALVEGVGVGKGKEDLTGVTVESTKSTQALPVRQDIPVGKACSLLTTSEIVSFLTGHFRLSKARTSDLFWEAVWPRLLARGWHSEQPDSHNYAAASKNSLVFLVPGVKKFSRKLVKGVHYFDSVSDVLGKVASDPELIELESIADNGCTSKEENGWTKDDTKLNRENSPDQPRHCYLKVKTPNRSTEVMKFTVVDTSLANEKVRELRSLPFGVLKACTLESDSDDENSSEEQTNESDSVNTTCLDQVKNDINEAGKSKTGKGVSSYLSGLVNNSSKEELPRSSVSSTSLSAASKVQQTEVLSNTQRREGIKCQSLQRIVTDKSNDLVPVTKRRRRLTACSRPKKSSNPANFFVVPKIKQEEASFCTELDNSRANENATANLIVAPKVKQERANYGTYKSKFSESVLSRELPPHENKSLSSSPTQKNKTLEDSLSNPSSIINEESVPDTVTSSSGAKGQRDIPQPRTMIDLNIPVSPEAEADEPLVNEVNEIPQNITNKESDDISTATVLKPEDHSDHQPDMHGRRQSTRNRPPTAKVLEAFALGYLDRKEKRSRSRDYLKDCSTRTRRRVSRKVAAGSSNSNGGTGFDKEEKTGGLCNNGNGSTSSDSNAIHTGFRCDEG